MKLKLLYERVCYRYEWDGWSKWQNSSLSYIETIRQWQHSNNKGMRVQVAKFYYADKEMTKFVAWNEGKIFTVGEED